MKNLVMIAIALVTINATAQDRKKDGPKRDMKERTETRQEMTPEETAQLQTKRMTLQLDLTEKQQVDIEKFLLTEAKTRKTKMEAFKAKKNKVDADKPSKEDRLKMKNDRLDHQIEIKKKMKTILNAEQYKKFEKMQGNRQAKKARHAKTKMQRD